MDYPFEQKVSQLCEIMSGFRRSHVFLTDNSGPSASVLIQQPDTAQPTSVLVRDLLNGTITSLVGGKLCFRNPETNQPKRVKIINAVKSADGLTLTLAEAVSTRDGDDACIEWPE